MIKKKNSTYNNYISKGVINFNNLNNTVNEAKTLKVSLLLQYYMHILFFILVYWIDCNSVFSQGLNKYIIIIIICSIYISFFVLKSVWKWNMTYPQNPDCHVSLLEVPWSPCPRARPEGTGVCRCTVVLFGPSKHAPYASGKLFRICPHTRKWVFAALFYLGIWMSLIDLHPH